MDFYFIKCMLWEKVVKNRNPANSVLQICRYLQFIIMTKLSKLTHCQCSPLAMQSKSCQRISWKHEQDWKEQVCGEMSKIFNGNVRSKSEQFEIGNGKNVTCLAVGHFSNKTFIITNMMMMMIKILCVFPCSAIYSVQKCPEQ